MRRTQPLPNALTSILPKEPESEMSSSTFRASHWVQGSPPKEA
jgi:hypothetical protein